MEQQHVKAQLRIDVHAKLAALTHEQKQTYAEQITRAICSCLEDKRRKQRFSLYAYVPFRNEVDIMPILHWCWHHQVPLLLPKTYAAPRRLKWFVVHDPSQLHRGTYGIMEPKKEETEAMEDIHGHNIVMVPGLAFDRKGGRLGYGGGYYDRWLGSVKQRLQHGVNPHKGQWETWAAAYEAQIADQVPMLEHDIYIDRIVTEKGWVSS